MGQFRLRCVQCGGAVPIEPGGADVSCPACGARYPRRDGIIEVTPDQRDEDYPEPLIDIAAAVQDRHFWFAARNDVIVSTMRRTMGDLTGRKALEVGCGTGAVLPALERAGMAACGIDMHRRALLHARARTRGPLVWTNAAPLPFFDDFDAVLLCDVIEHADDDVAVLMEAKRALKAGGSVVVTVPAGPGLWTAYDDVTGHKRRYDRERLAEALGRAGLVPRELSYFNILPFLAQRLHRRLHAASRDTNRQGVRIVQQALTVPAPPLNTLFRILMQSEPPLRRLGWRGGSLVAVARLDASMRRAAGHHDA